jgi:hypothetical protein
MRKPQCQCSPFFRNRSTYRFQSDFYVRSFVWTSQKMPPISTAERERPARQWTQHADTVHARPFPVRIFFLPYRTRIGFLSDPSANEQCYKSDGTSQVYNSRIFLNGYCAHENLPNTYTYVDKPKHCRTISLPGILFFYFRTPFCTYHYMTCRLQCRVSWL